MTDLERRSRPSQQQMLCIDRLYGGSGSMVMSNKAMRSRLRLRALTSADAAPTAVLMTENVSRWTATWPMHVSADEVAHRISDMQRNEVTGVVFARAIERCADGTLMGWINARKQSREARVASIGYWIGESFHGQGYMTEAAEAFLAQVWAVLSVDSIEAGAQPENTASIAILTRLGMHYVGDRYELAPVRNRVERCAWYAIHR